MTESTGEWQKEINLEVCKKLLDTMYPNGELPTDLTKFIKAVYKFAYNAGRVAGKESAESLDDFGDSFKSIIEDLEDIADRFHDKTDDLKRWVIERIERLEKKEAEGEK